MLDSLTALLRPLSSRISLRALIYAPSHSIPAWKCFLVALHHEASLSQEALLT